MSEASAVGDLNSWLFEAALPLWWEVGADHVLGGFHEALDREARPVEAPRRARVQARQTYVYATAGALGWQGPWREAVTHGVSFFIDHYRRPDGLYRTRVAPDGAALDDTAWLYDQAFALLAFAHATRALSDHAELRGRARALRAAVEHWRLPEGGFREPPSPFPFQSNAHMHLLEAALAWAEIDADPAWGALADEIVALTLKRFIDGQGALHEFFAPGWAAADGVDGRIVEPGHQFEWAWLLERWGRLRKREDARRAARRLYEIGVEWGVDARRGVANQQLLDDGAVHDGVARLWPQTEWIKAASILGDAAGVVRAVEGLKLYLDMPIQGLWRDRLRPDGSFVEEPSPASSFYHITCAIAEAGRGVG